MHLGSTVHLLVRETKEADGDLGAPPYLYAGLMTYVSHTGERPMRILWHLDHELPADAIRLDFARDGDDPFQRAVVDDLVRNRPGSREPEHDERCGRCVGRRSKPDRRVPVGRLNLNG